MGRGDGQGPGALAGPAERGLLEEVGHQLQQLVREREQLSLHKKQIKMEQ
jgi:hypothetical protein